MAINQGTAVVTILYPRDESSTFNLDYYLSTHMPMATQGWKEHGFLTYSVIESPDPNSAYSIVSVLTWEARGDTGLDGVNAGFASDTTKALTADVPNSVGSCWTS